MKKYLTSAVAAALLASFMVGCGSDDDDNTGTTPAPVTTYKAAFAATPVGETSGVSYTCGTTTGTIEAGSNGVYGPCEQADNVIFSLGNVELGQATYDTVTTNNGVVKATDLTAVTRAAADDLAAKTLSLLYSMDGDGDASNGVGVAADAVEELNKHFEKGASLATVETEALESATAEVAAVLPDLKPVSVDEAAESVTALEEAVITPPPGVELPVETPTGAN